MTRKQHVKPFPTRVHVFDIITSYIMETDMNRKNNKYGKLRRTPGLATTMVLAVLSLLSTAGVMELTAQVYPVQYFEEAVENNPQLKAQQAKYEAAMKQSDISGALPDPELSAGISTPPMERLMGDHWFDVGIMQMFPWFGTLDKQRSAADARALAIKHEYQIERNRIFLEMTRLWLQLYEKEQQLSILNDYKETLLAREDIIYARYAGGSRQTGLNTDLYRLEINLAEIENRKNKVRQEKVNLIRSFNIIAGRNELAEITLPDTLPEVRLPDIPAQFEKDLVAENPQLQARQASTQAAEIEKEAARLSTRPRFGLGLQYSYFASGDAAMGQMDGGHMLMPMVSVSLPLFGNKNRATRDQAGKLSEMAGFQEHETINQLQTQWANLETSLKNLQKDHEFYLQQEKLIQKTLDLIMTAYASGDEGFEELLRLKDQLLNIQWRLLAVQVQHQVYMAELQLIKTENIFQR